jgi:hypothetical protein
MASEDAGRLRAALYADQPRAGGPVADTLVSPGELPIPQRHRTVAVLERRIIGAGRHVVAHRATRAIMAFADPVYFYLCRRQNSSLMTYIAPVLIQGDLPALRPADDPALASRPKATRIRLCLIP